MAMVSWAFFNLFANKRFCARVCTGESRQSGPFVQPAARRVKVMFFCYVIRLDVFLLFFFWLQVIGTGDPRARETSNDCGTFQ